MQRVIRIGTRGSLLALTQTGQVADALVSMGVIDNFELVIIKTSGDIIQDRSLAEIGGKGLFIKEIEEALLDGRVDLAVHSMKDLPGAVAPGLTLEGMLPREIPNDLLISNIGAPSIAELPVGACLGTSSLRRQAQALAIRPDLRVIPLRGNVDTRLEKLRTRTDGLDAILLAAAGIARLEKTVEGSAVVPVEEMLPAIAQGTLGLEVRDDDQELIARLRDVSHHDTAIATIAERSLLKALSGSCKIPLAGYAVVEPNGDVHLKGVLAHPSGSPCIAAEGSAVPSNAEQLGRDVARKLLMDGGSHILAELGLEVGGDLFA